MPALIPVGVSRPAKLAASRPALSSEEVITPVSRNPGNAVTERIDVAPMLPVPHTATPMLEAISTP